MRDRSPLEDNASVSRQPTPLQDISAALTRSEAAFKMFRDFSVCGLRELVQASLQGLTNSGSLSAMDLYDRPLSEVYTLLRLQGIVGGQVKEKRANKACSPENFRNTAWTINKSDSVTLLVYGDRVVGIQKQSKQSPDQTTSHQ